MTHKIMLKIIVKILLKKLLKMIKFNEQNESQTTKEINTDETNNDDNP